MDGIEFTLGCAKSASDTTILINGCSTASETSGCLSLNLLFCKSKSEVIEGILGNSCLLTRDLSLCIVKGLNLDKNDETGTWYVSSIQSYDSSIAGTGAPATDTDTSSTESSTADSSTNN